MGVYIKGMEMPKRCYVCPFCDYVSARCDAVTGNPYTPESRYEKRADFCPLVPVPPHGDLIGRDELIENCMKEDSFLAELLFRKVSNAPTIIPAEEGE